MYESRELFSDLETLSSFNWALIAIVENSFRQKGLLGKSFSTIF